MVVVKVQPREAKFANPVKANILHKRYGYLNYRDLKLLCDWNAVIELRSIGKFLSDISNAIMRKLLSQSSSRTRDILELVGLWSIPFLDGAKYFITLIINQSI